MRATTALPAMFLTSLGLLASPARADEPSRVELSGSGFANVVAGKILKGTHVADTDLGYDCPCYISDYAQNGVYESGGLKWRPDSKVGLQGTASIDSGRYSVTAQAVARGSKRRNAVDLEWLYGTAELNGNWTVQVGRKRLPLFMSSEVQDVSYALPWNHLPPQLYGWEIVNYDGASVVWRSPIGGWLANAQVFAGNEAVHDAGFWQIYNGKGTRTDTRWKRIVGAEFKMSRDWFDARVVYLQSDTQSRIVSDEVPDYSSPKRQHIQGLSLNADTGRWIGRIELLHIDRRADYGGDHAQLYAAGYRHGSWTALVSYANYRQSITGDPDIAEAHDTRSIVFRYEVGPSSSVKLQFDDWRNHSGPAFASPQGDSQLISIGWDMVF